MKKVKKVEHKKKAKSVSKPKISVKLKTFTWNDAMSVHEKIIDEQHKNLLKQIERLDRNLEMGEELAVIRETLHFVDKYAQEHFSYEENYMKVNGYPKIAWHKKYHEHFIKFFESFKKEFEKVYKQKENLRLNLQKMNKKSQKFFGDWLVHHILKIDHDYAKYIDANKNKKLDKIKTSNKKSLTKSKIDFAAIKKEIDAELHGGNTKEQILEQRKPAAKVLKMNEKSGKHAEEHIKTQVPGFDDLFEKGIPKGYSILVAGGAGSGKTILCLQTLVNKAKEGKKCFYMSFEESEERLQQHMEEFGWDAEKLIKNNTLRIVRMNPFDVTRNVDAMLAKEKGELLIEIDPIVLPKNYKPDFIVVDSLTAIASAFTGKEDSYRIYIEQLFRFFERLGATTFLITETKQIPEIYSATGVEEFLADGVIVLYNIKRGDVRENAIEVLKMRGEKHQKKIVAMTISDSGVNVYPEQEVFGEIK